MPFQIRYLPPAVLPLLTKQRFVRQVHSLGLFPHPLHEPLDELLVLSLLLGPLLFHHVELHVEHCQLVLDVGNELVLDPELLLAISQLEGEGAPFGREVAERLRVCGCFGAEPGEFGVGYLEALLELAF